MLNRLGLWKQIAAFHRFLFRIGLGRFLGGFLLLLYVRGRKSGRLYKVPLMYDRIDGQIIIASARGLQADWLKNLRAQPHAEISLRGQPIPVRAQIITDLKPVADFILLRRQKRPLLRLVMRLEGLPPKPARADFEAYAANRVLVVLTPENVPSKEV